MALPKDITGQRFGRLTAIRMLEERSGAYRKWLFRCDCGKEKALSGRDVRSGHTRSCGCLAKEVWSRNMRRVAKDPAVIAKLSKIRSGRILNVAHVKDVRDRLYGCKARIQWRKSVFERDDFTCQLCGKRGARIEAHHLVGFAKLLKAIIESLKDALGRPPTDDEIYTEAQRRETLWHTSNGVVLCKDCHVETPNYRRRIGQEKAVG